MPPTDPGRPGRSRAARRASPATLLAAAALSVAAARPASAADEPPPLRCGTGVHAGETSGWVALP